MSKQDIKDKEIKKEVENQEFDTDSVEEKVELTEIETLEKELDASKVEVQKEKDNFLRLFAEFENYKKRTSKERIELFSTANKELMTVLLPILDDFERGMLEMKKSNDKALVEGVQLIQNKLKNTLNQKGLKQMEVKKGDVFDAEIHEAISQIPAPSKKLKGKIIDTVERGYKLGETIIRFPKVVLGN